MDTGGLGFIIELKVNTLVKTDKKINYHIV